MGNGKNKHHNCIGIDRVLYDSTDIVHDYNLPIPLKNNSVDMVMCSHSLQYVDDLVQVMQDIYRICKHQAIICIVAPYAHATVHMANPQFKQFFNEHSPKFWTNCPDVNVPVDGELPFDPDGFLTERQVFEPCPVDFRLLRMEFFYFPAYQGLYNEVELSLLRQSQLNVAYQIMYHLVAIKEPVSDQEFADISKAAILEEPDYIKNQRTIAGEGDETDDRREQPFNLDHLRSFSYENTDEHVVPINHSSEQEVGRIEQQIPSPTKSSKGKRRSISITKTRSAKRKLDRRKKKKRRNMRIK